MLRADRATRANRGYAGHRGESRLHATEPLLERAPQLTRLADALERADGGSGSAIVLEGPAGIGKTELLGAGCDLAARAGFQVLTARCAELEQGIAFGAARQLLEAPVRDAAAAGVDPWIGAARLAAPVFTMGGDAPSVSDPFAVLHGLYWLCSNLCDHRRLMLAVDDVQWGDRESMRWLGYLARRIDGLPVAVVMTMRSGPPEPRDGSIDGLLGQRAAELITLAPLSPPAAAELVRDRYDECADDAFCSACHRATRGNPFLLRELLAAIRRESLDATASAAERVAGLASPGVARSVDLRIEAIGEPARELARAIAVLGPGTPLHQAASLAGLPVDTATRVADDMRAADLLTAGTALDFVHPLVRSAVHAAISPSARAAAHWRAARLVDEAGEPVERVAAHLMEADPRADGWAVDRLRAAARRALETGAPEAAVASLTRALAELPDAATRPEVLLELGVAALPTDTSAAVDYFTESRALARTPRAAARATLWLAKALAYSGRSGESVAAVAETAASGDQDADMTSRLERELFLWEHCWTGNPDRPGTTQRLAAAADGLTGASHVERGLLSMRAWNLMVGGTPAHEALAVAERGVGSGLRFTDPDHGFELPTLVASVFVYCDAADRAVELFDGAIDELTAHGWVIQLAFGHAHRANAQFRRGALMDAEADAETAWELAAQLGPAYPAWWYGFINYVQALVARGHADKAAQLAESTGVGDYVPDAIVFPMPLVVRGQLRVARGDDAAGVDDLLTAGAWMEERGLLNPSWSSWRMDAAQPLARLGREEEARELVAEALVRARRFGGPWALGSALRAAGRLDRGDRSLELLAESVAVLDPSPCRLELARSLVAHGAALRRARRRADARDPLRRGLDLAHRCGAEGLEREARHELQATGARPRSGAISGVESLTPSELRVCRLAAAGRSNPDIAQALFVTRRTVESHLASAYRKLAIGSRAELAAALSPDRHG